MTEVQLSGKASDFLKIGVAAAGRGDVEAVRAILEERPGWITHVGAHGRTMLWEASHRGKLAMVEYLVGRGADIDARGTYYTPYFLEVSCYCIARHKGHDATADFLLGCGAPIDIHTVAFLSDREGIESILERASDSLNEGHPQHVAGEMTEAGLAQHLAPASWATPLCYALRGGDVETAAFLIARGAKITGNEDALFNAANRSHEKLRLLLENGADPEKLPPVYQDDGDLFALASSYGVGPPGGVDTSRRLVYLCRGDRGGNSDEVTRLLNLGADVSYQDPKGKTALHRASRSGFAQAMRVLLNHGASVESEDAKGETPLFDVIRSTIKSTDSKSRAVRILLEAGADPHHANGRGETPMSVAEDLDVRLPSLRRRGASHAPAGGIEAGSVSGSG